MPDGFIADNPRNTLDFDALNNLDFSKDSGVPPDILKAKIEKQVKSAKTQIEKRAIEALGQAEQALNEFNR